jgi:hypothetical protein
MLVPLDFGTGTVRRSTCSQEQGDCQ